MKSNELINYLNSIDASVKNKHQDFKIDKYNLSVVLFEITTTTSMEVDFKYKVSIIANKDDSNISCKKKIWQGFQKKFKHFGIFVKQRWDRGRKTREK